MQPVTERPNNSISQLKAVHLEQRIQNDIEWKHFAAIDVVSHLPAKRAARMKQSNGLSDCCSLLFLIGIQRPGTLVLLIEVVRRRGHNQVHRTAFQSTHECKVIGAFDSAY